MSKVWKFKDDIDTDIIIPGRYLIYSDETILASHCMEGTDPDFSNKCQKGDVIVAGENFGCGSSREHAPIAIKALGVRCVIAESFARIFYRNAINIGLLIIEAPNISEYVENGDDINVDMKNSTISVNGNKIPFKKMPDFMLDILNSGGLIEYLKK